MFRDKNKVRAGFGAGVWFGVILVNVRLVIIGYGLG